MPSQSHLIRKQRRSSPRKLAGFQEPCARNWGQRPNIRTKDAPSDLITSEMTRFQELRASTWGQTPMYTFYYVTACECI